MLHCFRLQALTEAQLCGSVKLVKLASQTTHNRYMAIHKLGLSSMIRFELLLA